LEDRKLFKNNHLKVGTNLVLTVDGKKYKANSKKLHKLFDKKEKGKWVFDGMEAGIMELIHKELATQLRKNRKVENAVVAAKDPMTGRLYFVEAGSELKFSYVEEYDIINSGGTYAYDYTKDLRGDYGVIKDTDNR
jgi:hypothetical protein